MTQVNFLGLTFNLYGLILGLGILAAFQSSSWLATKREVDKNIIERLFWWVVIGGIIGARAYHVIDKWNEIYSLNPQSVLSIWNGGLGIWGAVLGGLIGLYLSLLMAHLPFDLNLLDVALFGVPLGQAIGRWGNFFNNEIVGKNGEPLFFYESVLDLILFGILIRLARMGARRGIIAGMYLVGYGLIRLALEQLRPDDIIWKIAGFPTAALISVVAILLGLFLILDKSRKVRI